MVRWKWKKRRLTTDDAVGMGLSAAGLAVAVDLWNFALTNEGTITTTRSIYMCIIGLVVGFAAINKGMDLFIHTETPKPIAKDKPDGSP